MAHSIVSVCLALACQAYGRTRRVGPSVHPSGTRAADLAPIHAELDEAALLWDPRQAAQRNHPQIDIVNFRSIDNSAFPKTKPPWRFSMLYDGNFSRPAGLTHGSFDETHDKIPLDRQKGRLAIKA